MYPQEYLQTAMLCAIRARLGRKYWWCRAHPFFLKNTILLFFKLQKKTVRKNYCIHKCVKCKIIKYNNILVVNYCKDFALFTFLNVGVLESRLEYTL